MPAAAVIPALVAYINNVAVKKFVVKFFLFDSIFKIVFDKVILYFNIKYDK